MEELRIDADKFKDGASAKEFVDLLSETLKDAHGNLVPIYCDGRILGYAVSPDSPRWRDIVAKKK